MDTEEILAQHKILANKLRRVNKLKLQLSVFGVRADPSISMEIEDLEKEIAETSHTLNIKPEGIFIGTSVNLNDRRVLLLQVAYDQSNIVLNHVATYIERLFELCDEKLKNSEGAIETVKSKVLDVEDKLWIEVMALNMIFRENRLYFSKKADLALSGFIKKVSRLLQVDWFGIEENMKDEIIYWDDYIDRAFRGVVDVARGFIESENKS